MNYWYALQVKRGEELWLAELLTRQGYECYCPTFSASRRVSRHIKKMQQVVKPLFDRYLFMSFDRDYDRWGDIINMRDVDGFLSALGSPLPIMDKVIADLRRDCDLGVYNEKGLPAKIQKGDKVVVSDERHYFAGLHAEFVKSTGRRALIELKLFGRSTRIELPTALIERIT